MLSLIGPGAEQANKRLNRSSLSASHGSSLKKVRRALRIAAGLRPAVMSSVKTFVFTTRTTDGATVAVSHKAILHPTKGFKRF